MLFFHAPGSTDAVIAKLGGLVCGKQIIRCAIYTRKSSEEGLEQAFNSLEARREASRAYILSQKHEGWTELEEHYDDGGFSGGTMERPALKRLLTDIQSGKVQTVVVYKVDRLTRSLTDFAKIIDIFDSHKVSFVSVTQHFNTTSSMGRLTLNVLLSFAQFEREITGERIRDKIAASKKKGIWMGGLVPLGYDCVERRLVINPGEARTVREIFRQYLRLGSVSRLQKFLGRKQIRSKVRTSTGGRIAGGATYSRGALHHILNNHIYLGEICHRKLSHPGLHEPIVPRKLWDKVSALLQANDRAHRKGTSRSSPSFLTGKLFDNKGGRFTPTHAVKNAKRYRYFTAQAAILRDGSRPVIARFPAKDLEQLVESQILLLLKAPEKCTTGMEDGPTKDAAAECAADLAAGWPKLELSKLHELLNNILKRVVLGDTSLTVEVDKTKLLATLLAENPEALASLWTRKSDVLALTSAFGALRRGSQIRLVTPQNGSGFEQTPFTSLANAIARARDWYERIVTGDVNTVGQLAGSAGLTRRYVRKILQCAVLSPRITEAILMGDHRPNLMLKEIRQSVPLGWREQENRFLRFE
jgi:site-specific DNA recombinase